jgi:hypothetical protein
MSWLSSTRQRIKDINVCFQLIDVTLRRELWAALLTPSHLWKWFFDVHFTCLAVHSLFGYCSSVPSVPSHGQSWCFLGINWMKLLLKTCQMQELCGHRGFHNHSNGRPGRQANVWQSWNSYGQCDVRSLKQA